MLFYCTNGYFETKQYELWCGIPCGIEVQDGKVYMSEKTTKIQKYIDFFPAKDFHSRNIF